MRYRFIILGFFLGCAAILPQMGEQRTKDKDKDKKETEQIDITEQARAMNSDKFASPPTQFRTGHAKPRALDAKAIKKLENGFTIQLPQGADSDADHLQGQDLRQRRLPQQGVLLLRRRDRQARMGGGPR